MMIVERESLAKSEVEIAVANAATLLVSASRMIIGEVIPNFEAIVEQNEMSFAQKRKDLSIVRALLSGEGAVVPTLQKAAETIRNLRALSEAILFDVVAPVEMPVKPLPEGSLLRDTLRRLHYVQKAVESVVKWINDVGEQDHLRDSVLYTKTQQDLIHAFKGVVIQVQQATVVIGKYRDMGDIRVLREMTIDAQHVLNGLKEAAESVSEKRKSISFFKRAVEEGKSAPKVVRQLVSVMAGLAIVVGLSFAVVKLNAIAPQVFLESKSASEMTNTTPTKNEIPIPREDVRDQGKTDEAKTLIQSKTDASDLKGKILPKQNEATVAKVSESRSKEAISGAAKPTPPMMSPTPEVKVKTESVEGNVKSSIKPALKKAMSKSIEGATERKNEPTRVGREKDVANQKNLESVAPKRKTIVIED